MTHASDTRGQRCSATPDPALPCACLASQHDRIFGAKSLTRETGTQTSTDVAYYLLSTALSAARFGEVARAHWGVENGLHWVLDVTMNEDQARNCKDHGPQNMALLRRLALNLAKLEGSRESMKGKLYRAALSETFLTRLLAQFGKTQMR
jgi:predicted transposase YbfD/YdcC